MRQGYLSKRIHTIEVQLMSILSALLILVEYFVKIISKYFKAIMSMLANGTFIKVFHKNEET